MYSYIYGKLIRSEPGRIILENSGIGYDISVPGSEEYSSLDTGSELRIWTYLSVSQDAVALYGFLSERECGIFKMLITVSGIGPKGAMQILGALGADDLVIAVMQENDALISTAPGIGKKTARKLIIELKDKIGDEELLQSEGSSAGKTAMLSDDDPRNEAYEALVALGYSRNEAMSAVRGIETDASSTVEDILKEALKKL